MSLSNNLDNGKRRQMDSTQILHPVQITDDREQNIQRNRTQGYVTHCDGKTAIVTAISGPSDTASQDYWSVGQLMSVVVDSNRIVGLIYKVDSPNTDWQINGDNRVNIHIELIGEIIDSEGGKPRFRSGISNYPHLGAVSHRIRSGDLAAIYENNEKNTVKIGSITQDASIPAIISIDSLLSRHFAIVGTTGVGKSTSVALILRKIVEKRPDIRTLILDPHNEFTTAFPGNSITVDAVTLELPFWMFTLEEFVEVIYRGRPGIGAEVDALRDLIPEAKTIYENGMSSESSNSLVKRGRKGSSYTADTPEPYRMLDLFKLIDHRVGLLEGKAERPHLKSLKHRIELVMNDPRFNFMFESKHGGEAMGRLLSQVFRIPQNGKPICVLTLSGLPGEVVNVVVSVMCRLAFDLGSSSQGTIQTLVVCEEAHRYIPANKEAGFLPTRLAIARIAKEGRKYGVYLGVVTQRPGELDTTILSQCNTIFSMRLGNEHDQDIVRKAITGAANSTVSFLSSLANRECIAFGEAMEAPMRMTFENVAAEYLPGSNIYDNQAKLRAGTAAVSLSSVIVKMRELGKGNSTAIPDDISSIDRVISAQPGEQRPSSASVEPMRKPQEVLEQRQSSADNPAIRPQSKFNHLLSANGENSEKLRQPAHQTREREAKPSENNDGNSHTSSDLIRAFRPRS